jgi:hypothetical protein
VYGFLHRCRHCPRYPHGHISRSLAPPPRHRRTPPTEGVSGWGFEDE